MLSVSSSFACKFTTFEARIVASESLDSGVVNWRFLGLVCDAEYKLHNDEFVKFKVSISPLLFFSKRKHFWQMWVLFWTSTENCNDCNSVWTLNFPWPNIRLKSQLLVRIWEQITHKLWDIPTHSVAYMTDSHVPSNFRAIHWFRPIRSLQNHRSIKVRSQLLEKLTWP